MLTFAGKRLPSFVKVNSMSFAMLPNLTAKSVKVNGRMGKLKLVKFLTSVQVN